MTTSEGLSGYSRQRLKRLDEKTLGFKKVLTQKELKARYTYDEKTGKIFSKYREVGWLHPDGYIRISVDRKLYLAHRLAWLYIYGELPSKELDHINQNKADNRICNLRLADRHQNSQNTNKARKHSKLGVVGVSKNGNRYTAQIGFKGARIKLGYFDTLEQASACYQNAKRKILEATFGG